MDPTARRTCNRRRRSRAWPQRRRTTQSIRRAVRRLPPSIRPRWTILVSVDRLPENLPPGLPQVRLLRTAQPVTERAVVLPPAQPA
eukprot:2708505-Pyramimonas_sp.AAC.1